MRVAYLFSYINRDYPTKDFDVIIDIRSSLTVAALNLGIIKSSDLDEVSNSLYFFLSDDDRPVKVMYDPKFQTMGEVYIDQTSGQALQRLGNYAFIPTFYGALYSESRHLGTESNPNYQCPNDCESFSTFCSAPSFQFEFKSPTNGAIADLYALYNIPPQLLGIDVFSTELYVLNNAKMDPGRIACKSTQVGSGGKLGNLDPISATAFLQAITKNKPFKLAENYFFCYPDKLTTMFNSFGIAEGNASLFFALLALVVIFVLGYFQFLDPTVQQTTVLDGTLLIEIVKVTDAGGDLPERHKDFLATLRLVLNNEGGTSNVLLGKASTGNPLTLLAEILNIKRAGGDLTGEHQRLISTLRLALKEDENSGMPSSSSFKSRIKNEEGVGAPLAGSSEKEIELTQVYNHVYNKGAQSQTVL